MGSGVKLNILPPPLIIVLIIIIVTAIIINFIISPFDATRTVNKVKLVPKHCDFV